MPYGGFYISIKGRKPVSGKNVELLSLIIYEFHVEVAGKKNIYLTDF